MASGLFLTIILCGGILAFFLFKNVRNKQKAKLEITQKEGQIAQKQKLIQGQLIERKRLAEELHDGLGGTLGGIKMRLSHFEPHIGSEQFGNLLKDLGLACEEVRSISHNLMPSILLDTSLDQVISNYVGKLIDPNTTKVNLDFYPIKELEGLEIEVKSELYRIIQEVLQNVSKYAEATNVNLSLMKAENELQLLVEDNGVGFDLDDAKTGIGIKNIKSRVESLKGVFSIDSYKGRGTTVSIVVPII